MDELRTELDAYLAYRQTGGADHAVVAKTIGGCAKPVKDGGLGDGAPPMITQHDLRHTHASLRQDP